MTGSQLVFQVRAVIEDENRAVLILNRTIEDANKLKERLESLFEAEQIKCHTDNLTEASRLVEYETLLKPGDIIIATNLAGRGTDLCLNDLLKANGGLHVIITFMCRNLRVKQQGEGRAARQGEMVCHSFNYCSRSNPISCTASPNEA